MHQLFNMEAYVHSHTYEQKQPNKYIKNLFQSYSQIIKQPNKYVKKLIPFIIISSLGNNLLKR